MIPFHPQDLVLWLLHRSIGVADRQHQPDFAGPWLLIRRLNWGLPSEYRGALCHWSGWHRLWGSWSSYRNIRVGGEIDWMNAMAGQCIIEVEVQVGGCCLANHRVGLGINLASQGKELVPRCNSPILDESIDGHMSIMSESTNSICKIICFVWASIMTIHNNSQCLNCVLIDLPELLLDWIDTSVTSKLHTGYCWCFHEP